MEVKFLTKLAGYRSRQPMRQGKTHPDPVQPDSSTGNSPMTFLESTSFFAP